VSGANGVEEIEGTAVEITEGASVAVAAAPVQAPVLAVAPSASPKDLVARLEAIKEAQKLAMEEDVDYGVIPGTDKPTLFKPGAEKLAALFQLDVEPQNEKRWEADDHLTVISRVTIFNAPTGARLGSGEGLCTTREKKYGMRKQDRACPNCNATTIKKSKFPPRGAPEGTEPGWYCYSKLGGCGAEFVADDSKITNQPVGEVENPDLPDLWNTVLKMAKKRGFVDAVLAVTGASAIFTQDVEDDPPSPDQERPAKEAPRPQLDDETYQRLDDRLRPLGLNFGEVRHIFGAFGANGPVEWSEPAVAAALRGLTKDQAVKFEAHLEKLAQDRAATAPQGGGEADGS
jgi:hypothetical protein